MKAQRERFFTFFSDFRFLLNNLTEPNRRFGKVRSDSLLNKILRCLFMNTVPITAFATKWDPEAGSNVTSETRGLPDCELKIGISTSTIYWHKMCAVNVIATNGNLATISTGTIWTHICRSPALLYLSNWSTVLLTRSDTSRATHR